jgi:hypothetical protein
MEEGGAKSAYYPMVRSSVVPSRVGEITGSKVAKYRQNTIRRILRRNVPGNDVTLMPRVMEGNNHLAGGSSNLAGGCSNLAYVGIVLIQKYQIRLSIFLSGSRSPKNGLLRLCAQKKSNF